MLITLINYFTQFFQYLLTKQNSKPSLILVKYLNILIINIIYI